MAPMPPPSPSRGTVGAPASHQENPEAGASVLQAPLGGAPGGPQEALAEWQVVSPVAGDQEEGADPEASGEFVQLNPFQRARGGSQRTAGAPPCWSRLAGITQGPDLPRRSPCTAAVPSSKHFQVTLEIVHHP